MTDSTKRRGRPKGSEKKDGKALSAIADLLVANPDLRPTTAMRRLNPQIENAEVRRLQAKWQARGEGLLADAGARADARRAPLARCSSPAPASGYDRVLEVERRLQEIVNPSWMKALRGLDTAAARAASGAYDSHALRAACGAYENFASRALLELCDSPLTKAMREQQRFIDMARGISPRF